MKLTTREIAVFSMLGALMYASKIIMDMLPNIHLLGTLITAYTIVYRRKALYPIYVFVMLMGLFHGFNTWWIPYLYIWMVLWAMVMLLPRKLSGPWKSVVYMSVSAMHGFLYGLLYAPVQFFVLGCSLKATAAWYMTGIPWDITHGISNFFCGILISPLVRTLKLAEKSRMHSGQ